MTNEGLTGSLTTVVADPWETEDDFTLTGQRVQQQQVDNVNLICQALLHPR